MRWGVRESPRIGGGPCRLGSSERFVFFGPFGFAGPRAREAALGLLGFGWLRLRGVARFDLARLLLLFLDERGEKSDAPDVSVESVLQQGVGDFIALSEDNARGGLGEAFAGIAADAFGGRRLRARCLVCHRYLLEGAAVVRLWRIFVRSGADLYLV